MRTIAPEARADRYDFGFGEAGLTMGDRFAELDRRLSEANLARAWARYAYAATFTETTAQEHDAAADEADRLGELYLLGPAVPT